MKNLSSRWCCGTTPCAGGFPLQHRIVRILGRRVYGLPADAEKVFAPAEKTVLRAPPFWPYLLVAAAPIVVANVALQRIDLILLGFGGDGVLRWPLPAVDRTIVMS